jgi:DNA-binding transcriptional regulator YhcF (GntR family)
MSIRIDKRSPVPVWQQISAQFEMKIAMAELSNGDEVPSVRALAARLGVNANTVSRAYRDLAANGLVRGVRGSRLRVNGTEAGTRKAPSTAPRADLDTLIGQALRAARQHGYSLQVWLARVRERLRAEPPDHALAVSFDAGMRSLLKTEIESALGCDVQTCAPKELAALDRTLSALVIHPPGIHAAIEQFLTEDRNVLPLVYSSVEPSFDAVRNLPDASIIAVVSVSEDFLRVARRLLAVPIGRKHTYLECFLDPRNGFKPPKGFPLRADLIFCDVLAFRRLPRSRSQSRIVPYRLISKESLARIAALIGRRAGSKQIKLPRS